MKRTFVYLVLALMLSLLLCACGDMTDHGNVASSPWPDVPSSALPLPSMTASPTLTPDTTIGTGTDGSNNSFDNNIGDNTGTRTTSSPAPTEAAQR